MKMLILALTSLVTASLVTTIMLSKQLTDWLSMDDLIDDTPKLLQNSAIGHEQLKLLRASNRQPDDERLATNDVRPIVAMETAAVAGDLNDNIENPAAKPMREESLLVLTNVFFKEIHWIQDDSHQLDNLKHAKPTIVITRQAQDVVVDVISIGSDTRPEYVSLLYAQIIDYFFVSSIENGCTNATL